MLQVQDKLSNQPGPMTPEQDALVKDHSVRSRHLLAAAGVHDPLGLSATLHHHEHLLGERPIVLADIDAAMILPRLAVHQEVGGFPPGGFVKPGNGETAVGVRCNPRHASRTSAAC